MIPARALSALDPAEARAFTDHLAGCEECRRELQEWESTAAAMAVSANPMEPSPKVRERILDEIRNESKSEVIPFRSATRNIWTSFGSLGAIAAVILLTALIAGLVVLWRQNNARQLELARAQEFMELATTPGAKTMRLDGVDLGMGATAKFAYDKNGHAMLMADKLPAVPQGKAYQLWFIVGKNPPMPGKTFVPNASGESMSTDQMPKEAVDAAIFAVTVEPESGSVAPTSPIYLRSSEIK